MPKETISASVSEDVADAVESYKENHNHIETTSGAVAENLAAGLRLNGYMTHPQVVPDGGQADTPLATGAFWVGTASIAAAGALLVFGVTTGRRMATSIAAVLVLIALLGLLTKAVEPRLTDRAAATIARLGGSER